MTHIPIDIAALEALEKAATPRPWNYAESDVRGPDRYVGDIEWPEDRAFVRALRNAAPELIKAAKERDRLYALLVRAIGSGMTDLATDALKVQVSTLIARDNHLESDLAVYRAERDDAVARAKSAEQDWANREADVMRLTVQCEDAEREAAEALTSLRTLLVEAGEALKSFLHLIKADAGDVEDGWTDKLGNLPSSHCFELTWAPEEPGSYITAGQIRRAATTSASIQTALRETPTPNAKASST